MPVNAAKTAFCLVRRMHASGLPVATVTRSVAPLAALSVPAIVRRNPVKFDLPPLPYAYDALEPHMSAETLQFHHDKHHQAYVDNSNKFAGPGPKNPGR